MHNLNTNFKTEYDLTERERIELLTKIPLRSEDDKGCPKAKEGEYHYRMWDQYHRILRCGTCYAIALLEYLRGKEVENRG